MAYQNNDAISVGLVNIANTASISGLASVLTVGQSQSAAGTVLYLTQVPADIAAGQPIAGSNIAASSTVSSFVSGFATNQLTYTGTTATTVVAMTNTYGLSVGFGVGGTGLTYGTTVTSITNAGLPVVYTATSATTAANIVWIGTTTNVVANTAIFGTGIGTGTLVTSILANTYAILNQPITVTLGTLVTFVPTVTFSAAITANTLTQTVLFYPIIRMNQNSSAAVTQGTAASVYVNPTGINSAALVIQNGGLGVSGNVYFANNLTVTGSIVGSTTSATNIAGGTPGAIPIQSAAGVTTFINTGTVGQILQMQAGNTATWVSTGSLIAGTAFTATQVQTVLQTASGTYYPTFVSANNASATGMSVYTTSSLVINPLTGVGIGGTLNITNTATATPSSSFTNTGALKVSGATWLGYGSGVGLGNPVIVGPSLANGEAFVALGWRGYPGTATNGGITAWYLTVTSAATIAGWDFSTNLTGDATSALILQNTAASTSTTTGALQVVGGAGIGGSLFVGGTATILSTLASTGSVSRNALYVAGGVGIGSSLLVTGPALFQNNVTFSGTATYILTTNTIYTDNLIELHYPSTGTVWTVNDGKDIGLRFHYYSGADQNAFLGRANDTGYLEWYGAGVEDTTSTFTASTYGVFKTGGIVLAYSTSSNSTNTGALIVAGGAGIGGALYAGGIVASQSASYQTSLSSPGSGPIIQFGSPSVPNLYMTLGAYSGANNLDSNTRNFNISFSTGFGANAVAINATTGAMTLASISTTTSTTTGALTVAGGVGIGGGLYVGGIVTATNMFSGGSQVLTSASLSAYGVTSIIAGTDTAVSTSTGAVTIWNTGTLQTITNRGAVTTNQLTLNNGLILGSTAQNPILMNGNYTASTPSFIVAVGTLVGTTTTTAIYPFNYQHNLAPISTATIGAYYGQLFLPTLSNTATYTNMYGSFARIDMAAAATSGTVGSWYGFFSATPSRNAAADVRFTNHNGFYAQDPSSITATNVIGFASAISSSGGGTRYNIYASGTAQNRFSGWMGIGKDPTVALDVVGQVLVSNTLTVSSTIAATSTTTGALQIVGGVGIGGDVWTGGSINASLVVNAQAFKAGSSPSVNTQGAWIGWNFSGSNGETNFINQIGGGSVGGFSWSTATITNSRTTLMYLRQDGSLILNNGITSYSGALLSVNGGAYITGITTVTNTTNATSTVTGALTVAGGVGIGGTLYVGGLRGDATTSATTWGIYYNTATKELTTSTAAQAGASSGVTVQSTASNATYYPVFVSVNTSTPTALPEYSTSSFTINPSTGNVNIGGTVVGGGIRTTTTSTAPAAATAGDIWYNTTNDAIYRYTYDGVSSYWIDITGPTISSSSDSLSPFLLMGA